MATTTRVLAELELALLIARHRVATATGVEPGAAAASSLRANPTRLQTE